jgi:hypothetical protein
MSAVASLAFSAVSIAPGAEAEWARMMAILLMIVLGIAWAGLAYWARLQQRAGVYPERQKKLRQFLVGLSIIYSLGLLFVSVG